MSASVFHWNTVKSVEFEAGMPEVGEKRCMEEITQLMSVVRNAVHFTFFFVEPTASTHVWLWLSSSLRRCRSGIISKLRL